MVFTAAGLALLLLVAFEVYATILRARKRPGPLSEKLNRGLWGAASRLTFHVSRHRRHTILGAIGPLLLPLLGLVLIGLLILGFALIYYPRLPDSLNDSNRLSDWSDAVYFSGVTLLTIGYGDITPHTNAMRFFAVFEGVAGLAVLSLSTAYLLTVYGAVERKRAVAIAFYHQASRGADVPGFITHYFRRGRFYGLEQVAGVAARDIQVLMESHIEHPVIHYFHSTLVHKSFPRLLFLLLEFSAISRTCPDVAEYAESFDHPDIDTLENSALHVVSELSISLRLGSTSKPVGTETENEVRHRRCFTRALRRFKRSGVKTAPDEDAAFVNYVAHRLRWEPHLFHISRFLGYDWDEVSGDGGLATAEDEAEETPEL